jgi:ATP-dependent DNA ligase
MSENVMLCGEVYTPFNKENWIAEPKEDGDNIVIEVTPDKVTLTNRRGEDVSFRYPELCDPALYLKLGVTYLKLCSELVVRNKQGGSDNEDFHRLSKRSHLSDRHKIKLMSRFTPANVIIYDLIGVMSADYSGQPEMLDLTERGLRYPLKARKQLLNALVIPNARAEIIQVYTDCVGLFNRQKAEGKEGVIMKNLLSLYEYARSDSWLKVKNWQFSKGIYTNYEVNKGKTGITLYNATIYETSHDFGQTYARIDPPLTGLHRVSCNGSQSHKVRELVDRDGRVDIIVRHLATHHNPNALREPTFKGLTEEFTFKGENPLISKSILEFSKEIGELK